MLTDREKKIIGHLVDAHADFVKLPQQHPDDSSEWVMHIHALQRIIMSRPTVRDHKEMFLNTHDHDLPN